MKYFVSIIFILITAAATAQPQQKNGQIVVDGITRTFITYIPDLTDASEKLPIVISLHGRFGTGKQQMHFADFRPQADRDKFIIVCPDGIDRSWNGGRRTPANRKGINDVKFIDELITYIINTYNGDAKRVYVDGMSNGGFMASRLACELNNKIAAIAAVGASLDKGMDYQPDKPLPVMYIQGTKDPLVPFDGGAAKGAQGLIYSHEDVLKLWAHAAQCYHEPKITYLPDSAKDGTSIIKEVYINKVKLEVVGYTIVNGGHTWPGGTQYLPKGIIGPVSHNLNACEVIWDFFKGCRVGE